MRRIVHLSDLHFGWNERQLVETLCSKISELKPDLTIVSGDFVEHATRGEFKQAQQFLHSLPHPLITVPGNHDMPFYNFPKRLIQGLTMYRTYVSNELTQCFKDDELAVIGVNTARRLAIRGGTIRQLQVQEIEEYLCDVPPSVTRILVTHHPFDLPAEFDSRYLLRHGEAALERLACCLDLLLAGHMHVGESGRVADRFVTPNGSLIFCQAGTAISKRYKGERNSFNLIETKGPEIRIRKFSWDANASIYSGMSEDQVYRKESNQTITGDTSQSI